MKPVDTLKLMALLQQISKGKKNGPGDLERADALPGTGPR